MCGLAGIISLRGEPVVELKRKLAAMNRLLAHRGPDGEGIWVNEDSSAGLAHRRLSIIDLTEHGAQPMHGADGSVIAFNGEIYNFLELRDSLKSQWEFRSRSDTETILASHAIWPGTFLNTLRGMYSFAIVKGRRLLAARDPFGIKPFYYAEIDGVLYFASECKALLPFLPAIETDPDALAEYLTFQYQIGERTLFRHIRTLLPGHVLHVRDGAVRIDRYWDVHYDIDYDHTSRYFSEKIAASVRASIDLHMRSDVPVGSYISGGIDSSLMAALSRSHPRSAGLGFHGKFLEAPIYDESAYAEAAAAAAEIELHQIAITADDFSSNIFKVLFHLDYPVAGPGAFPQYMVSGLAAEHVKVVLGGQGGDEIFGGYARYLIAYLEQSLKASIDGSQHNGNFVVTPESIIPNLVVLQEYKPLLKQFFAEGLFGEMDARYFRLIDRSGDMRAEVDWHSLDLAGVMERYRSVFNSVRNVRKEAYFDSMTHFDFKCLLPALLQVEDRMSMAHGLEARVPLLDKDLVELSATIPADIKFPGGRMKHLLRELSRHHLPEALTDRRDKMGFPVPLKEWFSGSLNEFTRDIFQSQRARTRPYLNSAEVLKSFDQGGRFSRKTWGLLSLEIWHQVFHDRASDFRAALNADAIVAPAI